MTVMVKASRKKVVVVTRNEVLMLVLTAVKI